MADPKLESIEPSVLNLSPGDSALVTASFSDPDSRVVTFTITAEDASGGQGSGSGTINFTDPLQFALGFFDPETGQPVNPPIDVELVEETATSVVFRLTGV